MRDPLDLPMIGWREWVGLPGLGVAAIKAKVDTGARTSAIHAFDLEIVRRGGRELARFGIAPLQRTHRGEVQVEVPVFDRRTVRNSGGQEEHRYVVQLDLQLHGIVFPAEVTLTRRDQMGFRMLLGRTAVRGRYLIDPSRSYLAGRGPRKKKKKSTKRSSPGSARG